MNPSDARPGDIVLAHGAGWVSWLIRFGERLRFHDSTWNHCAIVVHSGADPICAQATGHGAKLAPLSEVAPGGKYLLVPNPTPHPEDTALYALKQVGTPYGFLAIVSIAINLLTPRFVRVDFTRPGTLICSALAALSLVAGGWLVRVPDLYSISPAELAEALGV